MNFMKFLPLSSYKDGDVLTLNGVQTRVTTFPGNYIGNRCGSCPLLPECDTYPDFGPECQNALGNHTFLVAEKAFLLMRLKSKL